MTANEPAPAPVIEHEIMAPTTLTLPSGRLNPAAAGWATAPIIDTAALGRGIGRNKRWEYWNIATPTHIVGLTVAHIDYACVPEIWVYNRQTGEVRGSAQTVIPPRDTVLAPTLEQGSSSTRAKDLAIDIDEVVGGTRLRAESSGVVIDVVAQLPEGHQRLALVVPWSEKRFQYTVKDVARPAVGTITVDGEMFPLVAGESWAVLDHGRGVWPYDVQWNWGAGSGMSHGTRIGIQVGAQWTDGTGVSENAFFADGIMHKIHGPTTWNYDISRWREPWHISGGGLDAMFTPFYNKVSRTNLLVLQGFTDQCFGYWQGSFTTSEGRTYEFADILGWVEEVHNRW